LGQWGSSACGRPEFCFFAITTPEVIYTAAVQPGDRLGPYEILAPLGSGGMGSVYSARDTRLGRTVAIKRTQERFSDRFEREARAISALNHPNICQLYDVGKDYLVMEMVDGVPVAPVDSSRKLLDLAVQMADGLAAAHAAGIVHRDLKPDNILVTRDGRVKILDFGLATERGAMLGAHEASTVAGTEPGVILGTVNYMSPEQARGTTAIGPQSDQFALGLVLYELAAGTRAFRRNSAAETLAAIIRDDPDPLPETTPAPVRWVIDRLLSKDPADRYDSTRDLHRELRHIRDRLSEVTSASAAISPATSGRGRRRLSVAIASVVALAGILLGGAAAMWFASRPTPATTTDLSNYTFTPITFEPTREFAPSWAPDGKSVAYVMVDSASANSGVFTRAIGSFESVPITRSGSNPFWSPDGSLIYFMATGSLWAVSSTGGTPEKVFDRTSTAAVHPDGRTIVFVRDGKFWAARRGEEPGEFPVGQEVASAPGARFVYAFSPDGKWLACRIGTDLWTLPYPSGTPRRFQVSDLFWASWMPDNRRLVLVQPGTEFSRISMLDTVTGEAHAIYAAPGMLMSAAVSPDGSSMLVTFQRRQADVIEISSADGRVRTMLASRDSSSPDWAPSGARYLFASDRGIEEATADERYSRPLIIAADQTTLTAPRWAPDGTKFSVWLRPDRQPDQLMIANASGRMLPLDPQASGTRRGMWLSDGQMLYERTFPDRTEVARIRPGSTAAPEILAAYPTGDARRREPLVTSPDGNWIVARGFGSKPQMYLMASDFSGERALPSEYLSLGSIGFSKDGREVMSIHRNTSGDGARWQLWAVDVTTGRERLVTRVDLPDTTEGLGGFSMHPDGTRILTSAIGHPADIWMLKGFDKK
jgi:serine/threonine protein kinase